MYGVPGKRLDLVQVGDWLRDADRHCPDGVASERWQVFVADTRKFLEAGWLNRAFFDGSMSRPRLLEENKMSKPTDEQKALFKKILADQAHALKTNSPRTEDQLRDLHTALAPFLDGEDA